MKSIQAKRDYKCLKICAALENECPHAEIETSLGRSQSKNSWCSKGEALPPRHKTNLSPQDTILTLCVETHTVFSIETYWTNSD